MRLSIENFIFLKIAGVNEILFGNLTLPSLKERVLKVNFLGARAGFPLIRLQALRAACTGAFDVAGIRYNPWREESKLFNKRTACLIQI